MGVVGHEATCASCGATFALERKQVSEFLKGYGVRCESCRG